jgi:hypothetical protein
MALTVEQARAAFQSAIPRRRDEFKQSTKDRLGTIAHESQYVQKYPVEVLRMAETEVRARAALAADRVKNLLDSGWRPENPTSVRGAFLDMFARFDHWQKDPSSDLYQIVEGAFGEVGVHAPDKVVEHARRLGTVQVQASEEWMSDLDCYATKYVDFSSLVPNVSEGLEEGKSDIAGVIVFKGPWKYDVFISHASDDKPTLVKALAEALSAKGITVWYDAYTLSVGDGLRESIDEGLKSSRYGIVVLSPAFFKKDWPKQELEGLFARQTSDGVKVILPVWHQVTSTEVAKFSPMLAGRLAAKSTDGIEQVVKDLLEVIRPDD